MYGGFSIVAAMLPLVAVSSAGGQGNRAACANAGVAADGNGRILFYGNGM